MTEETQTERSAPAVGVPHVQASSPSLAGDPALRIKTALTNSRVEGFLPSADARLIAVSDEITAQIGVAAVKIADGRSATAVDLGDVIKADDEVRGDKAAQRQAWYLSVAGILLGAGSATAVTLLVTDGARFEQLLWVAVGTVSIPGLGVLVKQFPRSRKD